MLPMLADLGVAGWMLDSLALPTQFLRRNLFILLGLSDLVFAAVIYTHEPLFNSQGASAMGFVLTMAIEGAALLQDAFMRKRKIKK